MQGHVRPARRKDGTIIKGVYDTVIDIGPDPYTGERRQKWKRIKGKREADAYVDEQIRRLREGTYVPDFKITFGEYAIQWLKRHADQKRNHTAESYRRIVEVHLIPAIGHYALKAITAEVLNGYYAQALESGKRNRKGDLTGEPLSATTVNSHHRIIHLILKAAFREHLIPRNPAEDASPPPRRKAKIGFLTSAQAKKFLETAKEEGSRYYPLYLAALTTGMRSGELLGWRWIDVDLDRGIGRVVQTLEKAGKEPRFGQTKSNKGRAIRLVPQLIAALREWKVVQDEERRYMGADYRDYGLVFTVPTGAPIDDGNLANRDFKPLLRKAGLPEIRFHDLRHSAATILLEMGVNPKIVAEMLGHSRVDVTLDTYSHATIGLQDFAVQKMEEALFDPSTPKRRRTPSKSLPQRQPWRYARESR